MSKFLIIILTISSCAFTLNANDTTKVKKLMIGGYGEAVYQNFRYSDDFNRYLYPEKYKSSEGYAKTDLPHLVLFLSYDFGKGWKFATEIEFEHGGAGVETEIEAEEFGEYESEVEKGGEIALEQFWLEKSFDKALNLRMGHIVVPIGLTNYSHFPTEYFTVLRPESENAIIPLTWHETGISLWGNVSDWRYEVQLINGLDVDGFGAANWIKGGAVSPYEFKLATNLAFAGRIDNSSIDGLRLGLSGYVGNSSSNSLKYDRYAGLDGRVAIGSVDAVYNKHNLIARVNCLYGTLSNSKEISTINKSLPKNAPSPHSDIAKSALCYSLEAGYNILSFFNSDERLYPFARYEYYNSMESTEVGILKNSRYRRQVLTYGINYFPINQIVVKAEYSHRNFETPYNQENTFSLGIMYTGIFN